MLDASTHYGTWAGERVAVLASGPSLTEEDAEKVRHLKTIAVNLTVRMAPWADALYAGDYRFWHAYRKELRKYQGLKFTLNAKICRELDVYKIKNMGTSGLGKLGVCNGRGNSGYQAVNLAYLLGAKEIIMLGFDMQPTGGRKHWHPDHPRCNPNDKLFGRWAGEYPRLHRELEAEGVRLINASRATALEIPREDLDCLV